MALIKVDTHGAERTIEDLQWRLDVLAGRIFRAPCGRCGGSGVLHGDTCGYCGGSGQR